MPAGARGTEEGMIDHDAIVEHRFTCPYCWEEITMIFELTAEEQTYVED
jgi:hypothetical protein